MPYFFALNKKKLKHITHSEEAKEIFSSESTCTFKAYKKLWGEDYSYELHDDTRGGQYKQAGADTLPGYFSWWSVQFDEAAPPVENYQEEEQGYKLILNPTHSFQTLVECSVYGTVKFSIGFQNAMHSYKEAMKKQFPKEKVKIVLKKGGTLRYTWEICYTVIVCAVVDGKDPFPLCETIPDYILIIRQPHNSLEYNSTSELGRYSITAAAGIIMQLHFTLKVMDKLNQNSLSIKT